MYFSKIYGRRTSVLLASVLVGTSILGAADDAATAAAPSTTTSTNGAQSQNEEIVRLKEALAAQQKQLEVLQRSMEQQQKLLEKAMDAASAPQTQRPNLGSVA